MFELVSMFFTAGGSAALGSVLKVFGAISDSRQQKFELELAREARGNEFALKFQEQLNSGEGGMFIRVTRRMLSFILCSTSAPLSYCVHCFPAKKSSPSRTQVEKKPQKSSSVWSHSLLASPPLF